MSWTVDTICVGSAVPFRGEEHSAIGKSAQPGIAVIRNLGIVGDEQADPVHHGGPDMALHHYPRDHHAFWRGELGDHPLLQQPGAFGSNLSVTGLLEEDVLLGDRFRLGTALIEACQPRQPCWKIEHRFGHKGMVKTILRSGRCGWFYRVIEEGETEAGQSLERESRGDPGWSMIRMFDLLWGSGPDTDPGKLAELAVHAQLPDKLRAKILRRI